MSESAWPLPRPDAVTQPFWDGCRERQLRFQRCDSCGHRWLPPSVLCPRCWSDRAQWVAASGSARVFSFAVYHRPYHPAFEPLVPYVVAVVELSEGPRLVSNVVDAAAGDLRIGAALRLEFRERGGFPLPVFRLAEKESRG